MIDMFSCKKCQNEYTSQVELDAHMYNDHQFHIKSNDDLSKKIMSTKIYESDASAFREQYVNSLSHGCMAYHEKYGYTDDVYVRVVFDYAHRKVTIIDNGMGMSEERFQNMFMAFGFSSVDEKTNNQRSGMFGLGAISFYRIASSCIVESWHRETENHFTYMIRGTERAEAVNNKELETYGTKIQIFLKESIDIQKLVDVVKIVGNSFPVRTELEVINSDSINDDSSISSYNKVNYDDIKFYDAVRTFDDHAKKFAEIRNVKMAKIIDNDMIEAYITSLSRTERSGTYLCRVPISTKVTGSFSYLTNIKKEKFVGEDEYGETALLAVPMVNRDRLEENADDYFEKILESAVNEFISNLDFSTTEKIIKSPHKWVLEKGGIDDKLNTKSRSLVDKLRSIKTLYRDKEGMGKRNSSRRTKSLWEVITSYDNIFYSKSLSKSVFDSLSSSMEGKTIFIGKEVWNYSTNTEIKFDELQKIITSLEDALEYKKENSIKTVSSSGRSYNVNTKCWLPTRGYAIDYTSDNLDRANIGKDKVYYAGDIRRAIPHSIFYSQDEYYSNTYGFKTKRVGLVAAQKNKKDFVNFLDIAEKLNKMVEDRKVKYISPHDNKVIDLCDAKIENPNQLAYNTTIVQSQMLSLLVNPVTIKLYCDDIRTSRNLEHHVLFVPSKYIHEFALATKFNLIKSFQSKDNGSINIYVDNSPIRNLQQKRLCPLLQYIRSTPDWKELSDVEDYTLTINIQQSFTRHLGVSEIDESSELLSVVVPALKNLIIADRYKQYEYELEKSTWIEKLKETSTYYRIENVIDSLWEAYYMRNPHERYYRIAEKNGIKRSEVFEHEGTYYLQVDDKKEVNAFHDEIEFISKITKLSEISIDKESGNPIIEIKSIDGYTLIERDGKKVWAQRVQ